MSPARPRIYADFNGMETSPRAQDLVCIDLHRRGSLEDLCRLQLALVEGMDLSVHMDSDEVEDIEVAGVVFFERETGRWMVEFDHKEIRDVPRTQTAWEQAFPCFQCRNDLTEQIQRDGLSLGDVCSNCGFAIHHPIMPPGAR